MSKFLFSNTISDIYKNTSEFTNSFEVKKKDVRKKTLQGLLQESFFHGASRFGGNFIG